MNNSAVDGRRRWSIPAAAAVLAGIWWSGVGQLADIELEIGPRIVLCGENDLPPLPLAERVRMATDEPPDLVIWPELAYHDPSAEGTAALVRCSRELGAAIVMGSERVVPAEVVGERAKRYNAALFAAPEQDEVRYYDKRRPTPWAEYLPWQDHWPTGPRGRFDRGVASRPFQFTSKDGRVHRFACLICYDLCFSDIAREAAMDADFLVDLGAEGQDASGALPLLMERGAKLRAIETGRPLVRNVSGGQSGIVDSRGRWTAAPMVGDITTPVCCGQVPLGRRTTLYSLVGDAWIGVVAAWVVLAPALAGWPARSRGVFREGSLNRFVAPAT